MSRDERLAKAFALNDQAGLCLQHGLHFEAVLALFEASHYAVTEQGSRALQRRAYGILWERGWIPFSQTRH